MRLARAGFTLVELLVVVAIIAILVTISVKYMSDARVRAKETETAANLSEIHKALETFATDNNGLYPFRMRWFDPMTSTAPGFDPYTATDTGSGMTSDPSGWFSLGLFGGVKVVTDTFADNTFEQQPIHNPTSPWQGMKEHKVLQPYYGNDPAVREQFYAEFNQYSDPLVALGYIASYPGNPFLKRPMGNIMWNYGATSAGNLDKTIPGPDVLPTPGDFCYTFFYGTSGGSFVNPPGIVEAKKSYVARSPAATHPGVYYLDLIDSYQMWAYGKLTLNGSVYVAYPNNASGLSPSGLTEAKRDFDNSGTKDMFEIGMIAYYKQTGAMASQATSAGGNKVEF
jgi:prepilin-type N-terminal cleavage/methylation domain-containing protein